MKRIPFWSKREVCFHFVPQHVTNLAVKLLPKNHRALAEEKLKTTGRMILLPMPIGQSSDHFEDKIYQMESSKEIIILPKIERKKPKNIKQNIKKVKRKGGTNSSYLWRRGDSKKTNKICIARRAQSFYCMHDGHSPSSHAMTQSLCHQQFSQAQ